MNVDFPPLTVFLFVSDFEGVFGSISVLEFSDLIAEVLNPVDRGFLNFFNRLNSFGRLAFLYIGKGFFPRILFLPIVIDRKHML